MKKHIYVLLLSCFMINSSCEELCEFLEKCDLVTDILVPVASVVVGADLNIINDVENLVGESAGCTDPAGPSQSAIEIFYKAIESDNWEKIQDFIGDDLGYPQIDAGVELTKDIITQLNEAGFYRFGTETDATKIVEERLETNNTDDEEGEVKSSSLQDKKYVIVKVLPDPITGVTKIKGKPQVELIQVINRY